jgi:hypothetical protein
MKLNNEFLLNLSNPIGHILKTRELFDIVSDIDFVKP